MSKSRWSVRETVLQEVKRRWDRAKEWRRMRKETPGGIHAKAGRKKKEERRNNLEQEDTI